MQLPNIVVAVILLAFFVGLAMVVGRQMPSVTQKRQPEEVQGSNREAGVDRHARLTKG